MTFSLGSFNTSRVCSSGEAPTDSRVSTIVFVLGAVKGSYHNHIVIVINGRRWTREALTAPLEAVPLL